METQEIDVVILCGGLGKRLKSVIKDRPKAMAEINHRPFLDILIEYVAGFGFRRFVLCIGYLGDFIRRYYQNRTGSLEIVFSEEQRPLGTAGAIKNAESLIKSSPFLVMNGDSFCKLNLHEFLNFHKENESLISMALTEAPEDSDNFGQVILGDSRQIIGFNEKKKAKGSDSLTNSGVYLLEKDILSEIPENKTFSLEYDLFPKMAGKGLYGYITGEIFLDIGTPEGYEKTRQFLRGS